MKLKQFMAMLIALLLIVTALFPIIAHASEGSAQCAYTVKVYYDFYCDDEQSITVYFDEGDYIEVEDVIDYFLPCYCDFCKRKVEALDPEREYCKECYKNGCNQFTYLKCLGTDILAKEQGGAIHVYFVSSVVNVNAYRFYGNKTDNENAINNAHATYKHIAAEGILFVGIILALTFCGLFYAYGYIADYKADRERREELDDAILKDKRKSALKDNKSVLDDKNE